MQIDLGRVLGAQEYDSMDDAVCAASLLECETDFELIPTSVVYGPGEARHVILAMDENGHSVGYVQRQLSQAEVRR
jgi:hypothetical protein